jgi:hypothetical protein
LRDKFTGFLQGQKRKRAAKSPDLKGTPMPETNVFEDLIGQSPSRRSFARKLGLAGAAVAGLGATRGMAQSASPTDTDILNFALNLEYLEAEFYTVATAGVNIASVGLTVSGSGASGATTGGAKVPITDSAVQAIAAELAFDEQTHVALLQGAIASIGGTAIAKPAINLGALGLGFSNMNDFLTLARVFEDIGVTAYGGAAPLISNKTILGYAARILATEAFHSGSIRDQIARLGITVTPVDGADHVPPPFGTQYFNTDSNAISEVRTPGQVLYLAYAKTNATSGGFFPNGVNGNINTSAASSATTDGASITLSPNPILVSPATDGLATISWNAPSASVIQIRVGSPTGALFTTNVNSGSMQTGTWITNGTTFYLQDVSGGKSLTSQNTLATVTAHLQGF